MANKTPEQISAKYERGVQGAGQDYANGVASPSRPWAAATAAAQGAWAAGIQAAIGSGAFQKGVQRAGDQKWAERTATIGAQRYVQAAGEAAKAFSQTAGKVMSAAAEARRASQSLPGTNKQQRIQRAVAAMNATSEFWSRNQ